MEKNERNEMKKVKINYKPLLNGALKKNKDMQENFKLTEQYAGNGGSAEKHSCKMGTFSKKAIYVLIALCLTLAFSCNKNDDDDDGDVVEETLFRMTSVNIPDSVVFTLIEGEEISTVSVFLVSDKQSVIGKTYARAGASVTIRNGELYFLGGTVFITKEFAVPSGFNAKKIKFEVEDKTLYYNIAKKKWTKN
jgi:hypothetical protein